MSKPVLITQTLLPLKYPTGQQQRKGKGRERERRTRSSRASRGDRWDNTSLDQKRGNGTARHRHQLDIGRKAGRKREGGVRARVCFLRATEIRRKAIEVRLMDGSTSEAGMDGGTGKRATANEKAREG